MSKKLFVFIKKFAAFNIKSSGLLLLLCLAISFQQCSSPELKKTIDPSFDSLAVKVNLQLKTNVDSALVLSKNLYEYSSQKKEHSQMFQASYLRGRAFEFIGKNDSALQYYKKMQNHAFQLKDTVKILQSYNALGTIFNDLNVYDSVEHYYGTGIKFAASIKDSIQLANFTANIGLYYEQCNQFDSAMFCYTKAVFFYEKLHDSINMALLYRNLGNILTKQNIALKAKPFFFQAIEINKKLGNPIEEGLDYSNLAITYKQINNDSVNYYFQKAMKLLSGYGSVSNLMMTKFNFANYLKSNGKINEAEKLYKEVLQLSIDHQNIRGQLYSYNLLAKIAVIKKNAKQANDYFSSALNLAQKNKLKTDVLRLYLEIFEGNMDLRKIDLARFYFKRWFNLNDSLQTSNQKEAIIKYNTIYETEKKELAIKLLESERESSKIKSKYLGFVFLFAMLGALAVLYAFWTRSRQKLKTAAQKQKAQELELYNKDLLLMSNEQKAIIDQQEIASSQKLLVSKMLLLSHHSEFLSNTLSKLQELNQQLDSKEQQDNLIGILNSIQNQVKPKRWDDFQQQYMQSHEDFFTKLNQLHPNLTAGDHRLCAMLRMNLSIKEISDLTLQTPRAIEMARFRLRNKFGLEREDNLTAYLSRF
ncbi:MAG: hypothetical protein WCO13_15010 [Bacteroidota bacterium]